jgi:flavin reductase (DIM6/NTAB) family NADH-FMN oxidoreductase RutF
MEETKNQLKEAFFKGIVQGLYILTVKEGEKLNGMTAALVSRVCPDPPLVMVSIGKKNYTNELIKKAGHFVINTLAEGQQDIGRHFGFVSGREVDKLKDVEYFTGETGTPILKKTMSYLECEVVNALDTNGNTLFVGKVIGGQLLNRRKNALVYDRDEFY